jgi:hypothetical protein
MLGGIMNANLNNTLWKKPVERQLKLLRLEIDRYDRNVSSPYGYIPPHVSGRRSLYADWLRHSLGTTLSALETLMGVENATPDMAGIINATVDGAERETEALALLNDWWEHKA